MKQFLIYPLYLLFCLWFLTGCVRPDPTTRITIASPATVPVPATQPTPLVTQRANSLVATYTPEGASLIADTTPFPTYVGTPTPDPIRPSLSGNGSEETYITHYVDSGETLGYLAQLYGSSLEELASVNQLDEDDYLVVGQLILVPQAAAISSPSLKIIPDSELVYGPAIKQFGVRDFVTPFNGYLLQYGETVEGAYLEGPEIVQLVAERFSVNPRLLLAMLEYRSGWVTRSQSIGDETFPLVHYQAGYDGLYTQLSWAANELNWAFYGRSEGGVTSFLVADGTRVAFAADINDGTAAVQNWLGSHSESTYQKWLQDVRPSGFYATYYALFGNPFAYTIDPLWQANLSQPTLRLPWATGETWYLTGGPHGGWATGSAWAALDFVPEGEQSSCLPSTAWATAMADGLVVRSSFGAVVVDLDGDGFIGTGWVITYMHLAQEGRINANTWVQAGDRLGHPSCEGGFSNATHLHIARTYNGRWVAADGSLPFTMNGWVAEGAGREYDGYLVRGNVTKEACECRTEENAITAD